MKKYLQKLDTLGLVLLVAAVIWYSISNIWDKWNLGLAIAGGVLFLAGIAANYRQILASFGKRSTKYAGNYVISLILVIAIVSGLNYIGQKHVKRFDTTASKQFSLAPQTIKILQKLDKDVDFKAFVKGGNDTQLQDLLVEYRTESKHVHYEFIDPDRHPDTAKRYDVNAYGTIVITYGERKEKIEKRSGEIQEEDLTNALIKVGRSEIKKVYFIQGHGEKDPMNAEQSGYSEAKKALESQSYAVATLNLASEGKVPDDAKVLVLAGPKTEPFAQELQFVTDFLNKGSAGLLVMVDPTPSPSLQNYLKDWGILVDNDLVLDVSGAGRLMGAGPSIPLVIKYENHKITDRFNAMTFFPLTRSIHPESNIPKGITVETLFKSNPNSWGETNLNNAKAEFNPGKDLQGPLSLAVAATKETKASSEGNATHKARMVVVGTSNFAIDAYFGNQGNGNLFLNMVSWLAQDEDLISIRPKPVEDRRIMLSQSQMAMLRLLTLYVLPGIVLVIGTMVFMNRRRR
jgi:ABC-type uncharacterized transport system involved in gliding motility auxiliary subunit